MLSWNGFACLIDQHDFGPTPAPVHGAAPYTQAAQVPRYFDGHRKLLDDTGCVSVGRADGLQLLLSYNFLFGMVSNMRDMPFPCKRLRP